MIISKQYFGGIVETDTCNDAKKYIQLICDLVVDIANLLLLNASKSDIRVHKGECWHHLRNVCIGSANTHLSRKFSDLLEQ